jgi:hypothetical protein
MAAAVALGAIHGMMVVAAFVVVAWTGNDPLLWRSGWYFADILAIILGAAIVRMLRQSTIEDPSNA